MLFSIPILIEGARKPGAGTLYEARPLFHATPWVCNENLSRLMTALARDLTRHLDGLGRHARHDELAAYTFNPRLAQERLDLSLDLRKRVVRGRFFFLTFRHLGRRIAFTPKLPDRWFDLARGESLKARAQAALTLHYRQLEQDGDAELVRPEDAMFTGTAWVQHLEVDVHPPRIYKAPSLSRFLTLGGGEDAVEGAAELRRVGRCLDWLYPDELDVVLQRDAEAAELQRLLDAADRRPVLLVGPRQVGKTALVHEYVRRTVSARPSRYQNHRNTWLLAPARLISGMSYVGQWENRLLAILKETRKRDHLLYFDDLIGLFRAGQTSQSSLSAAQVMKPYLERRDLRLLAEITPEAYRVLRERDRGLADLFHVFPVAELSDAATLRVLIGVQRQLEDRHRCRFALDVLPTVLDLQRRYVRDTAFPGKAAGFLQQLAVKHRRMPVARLDVLIEFQARSGLAGAFLNDHAKLERDKVVEHIGQRMIGQESAVEAAADVISVAKARLNDPDRPLASFLFLGPTGVGKTQCAKAVAAYLFSDPDRLVRFDMNEFVAPGSAARLAGTFDQPEGLLTAAIRRQPFAVVLFDEIEKAHPEVFDLLLAVLGEGRLTDALGRTADFTSALLILTSNLGVREAEGHIGFGEASDAAREAVFVRAAERFFRPEFFNRLDRVIPFRRLTRAEVARIAALLIQDVFGREGLTQRKCILLVEPAAMERVIDHGFDPDLGARALKRAIERYLTQPVAARLAGMMPDRFTVVRMHPRRGEIAVHVQALEQVEPSPAAEVLPGPEVLASVEAALRRVEQAIAPLRPEGPVSPGAMKREHYRYFAVREVLDPLREQVRALRSDRADRHDLELRLAPPPQYGQRSSGKVFLSAKSQPLLREMAKALNIEEYIRDLVETARPETGDAAYTRLVRQSALLRAMMEAIAHDLPDRAVLLVRPAAEGSSLATGQLAGAYRSALTDELGLEADWLMDLDPSWAKPFRAVLARGMPVLPLLRGQAGTHLISWKHERMEPLQLFVLPVPGADEPARVLADWFARTQTWHDERDAGRAEVESGPAAFGPVVRLYEFDPRAPAVGPASAIDFRTGMVSGSGMPPEFLHAVLLAGLSATVRDASGTREA